MNSKIWGVVSLVALSCGLIVGTSLIGTNEATLGQITVMLGMVATTIPALISASKADSASKTSEQLSEDLHNGTLEKLLREAIVKVANDESTKLEITQTDTSGKEDE
jgi:hypothetical protein